MPKNSIRDYSATNSSNTEIQSIDISEGCSPAGINNAIREIMADTADFVSGTVGIDVLSLADNDASHALKFQAPASVTTTVTFTLPDGDGTNGQSLITDGSGTLSWGGGAAFAAGMVMPTASASAPSGWLMAYGQAVSRSTYADLFTAIGTVYGVGDGSSTFNLPDLRGRVIAGQDNMGGSAANRLTSGSTIDGSTLGTAGGGQTHTLTTSELAAHNHVTSATSTQHDGGNHRNVMGAWDFAGNDINPNTGGGAAHANVQPTIVLNYIIKT